MCIVTEHSSKDWGFDLKYILLTGLTSAFLISSCGDDIKKTGNNSYTNNSSLVCLVDTDCDVSFVCEQELCVQTCATRTDCPPNLDCLQRVNGSESICVEVSVSNNINSNINSSINNTNNSTNNNETPLNINNMTYPPYFVLLTDTTTGEGCESSMGGEGQPGSDIVVVLVEDFEGTVLGYGEAIEWVEGSSANGNGFPNVYQNLDGTPPGFGDQCPESFDADTVASLGCGGYVLLRFLDNTGKPLSLDDSQQIRVLEYGAICGDSADDTFRISLCTDAVDATDGSITSCTIDLGAGSGLVVAEVRLP